MHSSPASPIAVGRPSLIMDKRVLLIGRPIGIRSALLFLGQSKYVTSTVASVGPYRFVNLTAVSLPRISLNRVTWLVDRASPLENTCRIELSFCKTLPSFPSRYS